MEVCYYSSIELCMLPSPMLQDHSLTCPFVQACNGQRASLSSHPNSSRATSLLTPPPDPLPDRPNNYNRTPKNPPLLRAAPKAQRNSSLLRRPILDSDALAPDRFPRRVIRDLCLVWRFPGHDCWLCEEYSGYWSVYWDAG